MKKYKIMLLLCSFMLIGTLSYSQIDCETLQCDCENVPDADKDPGLKALCEYYEKNMIELCKKGDKTPKCHAIAKGPNAWTGIEIKSKSKIIKPKKEKIFEFDEVDVPKVKNISEIKYCNQLMSFIRKNGYLIDNIRVAPNSLRNGNFKEAWAYDYEGDIYVVVVMSKDKNKTDYEYELDLQYEFFDEYQTYLYCDIKASAWRKFSDTCNNCNYNVRFEKYIKNNKCKCL